MSIIVALGLRPNCEYCDEDLQSHATEARICAYECTFCADCVATKLRNVCPNCGGGFTPRPIRPVTEWRPSLSPWQSGRRLQSVCIFLTVGVEKLIKAEQATALGACLLDPT